MKYHGHIIIISREDTRDMYIEIIDLHFFDFPLSRAYAQLIRIY